MLLVVDGRLKTASLPPQTPLRSGTSLVWVKRVREENEIRDGPQKHVRREP